MATPSPYLLWVLTKRCNFRCDYCYFPGRNRAPEPPVDPGKVLDFLDADGREWTVGLTGGEPLVYRGVAELCRRLTQRHRLALNTNLSVTPVVRQIAENVDPGRVDYIYASAHMAERVRRRGMDQFIANVRLLMEAGFPVTVNYVLHPTAVERFPADRERLALAGVRLKARPFKGVHEGVVYPGGYDQAARALLDQDKAGKKQVINFRGVLCRAGRDLARMEPGGTVRRCSGDHTILGNVHREVRLHEEARPCRVGRCPCFGPDFSQPKPLEARFLEGLAAHSSGRDQDAEECFRECLAQDQGASNARHNLGLLARRAGRAAEALEHFLAAHAAHPGNKGHLWAAVHCLAQAGSVAEARDMCEAYLARRADPEVAELCDRLNAGWVPSGEPPVCVEARAGDHPDLVFPLLG